MATITTLVGTDGITTANSMTKINANFANLNSDKIETSVIDTDTAMAADSDAKIPSQKAVKAYIDTQGGANASEIVRGIVEEATDAEVTAGTATGGTGAKLVVTPAKLATRLGAITKFGGDGSDGALSISSGTTTVNLGAAAVVIKNYTSISITGTGVLAFSNPHANGTVIILKSQGAVTITSGTLSIDTRGMGASAGNSPTGLIFIANTMSGGNGSAPGTAGTAGAVPEHVNVYLTSSTQLFSGTTYIMPGAGGGTGGTGTSGAGGTGGTGGGALLIQCAGALNFTGVINSSGSAGTAGTGGVNRASGGAGGGSAGMVVVLYNTLTANSGTITATGGDGTQGGAGSAASGSAGGGGGGAASVVAAGGAGGSGNGGGAAGSNGGTGAGAGGNTGGSGTGQSTAATGGASMGGLVAKNDYYV